MVKINSTFFKLACKFNEGPKRIQFLSSKGLETPNFDMEINQADIKDHFDSCHKVKLPVGICSKKIKTNV